MISFVKILKLQLKQERKNAFFLILLLLLVFFFLIILLFMWCCNLKPPTVYLNINFITKKKNKEK